MKIIIRNILLPILLAPIITSYQGRIASSATLYDPDDPRIQAGVLCSEGSDLVNQKKYREALQKLEISLAAIQTTTKNESQKSWCFLYLGIAKMHLMDITGAYNALETSLNIALSYDQKPIASFAKLGLGKLDEVQGRIKQSDIDLQQSLDNLRPVLEDIKTTEDRLVLEGLRTSIYEALVVSSLKQNNIKQSFELSERARSRAFLDQLSRGNINIRSNVDPDLLIEEKRLNREIAKLRYQRIYLSNENTEVSTELKEREKEYSKILLDIRRASPSLASLATVSSITLEEVQERINEDTTLLDYFITNTETIVFVISKNKILIKILPINKTQLLKQIGLIKPESEYKKEPYPNSLKNLYQGLIGPIKSDLKTSKLGIIPHSALHQVPFSALTDGQHYLKDSYTLFYLPSVSTLKYLETNKRRTGIALVMGNPDASEPGLGDLSYAKEEAKEIANIYQTKAYLGQQATESIFWQKASQSEVIHLATHARYKSEKPAKFALPELFANPLLSAIYLAGNPQSSDPKQDGYLQIHEIYELDLRSNTNLVVLSACDTQKGDLQPGDEILSINRAFLYAGTPAVLASLWVASDEATQILMKKFHQNWRSGMGRASALQKAQTDLTNQYPNYRAPYYWSNFILTGESE